MNNDNTASFKLSNPNFGVIIKRGKGEEIPDNAVRLNLTSVVSIQRERLKYWVPQEDVWTLRHSSKLIATFTGLTSSITVIYVRRFFQLHAQKLPTTVFPSVIVPLIMSGALYEKLVNKPLLQGLLKCPLCMEMRGSVLQLSAGSIFPLLISCAICIPVAKMEKSYPIPKLSEYRKFYDMWKISMARGKNVFISMAVFNFMIGGYIVNRGINCLWKMEERDKYIYKNMLENNDRNSNQ